MLIQSSSAAGKSSLMDAVLNLIPEEERLQYSAMDPARACSIWAKPISSIKS
nr:hypothetical protein [Photorhabdus asymbiotica]